MNTNRILMAIGAGLVLIGGFFLLRANSGEANYRVAGGTDGITENIVKDAIEEHGALGDGSDEALAATSDTESLDEFSKAYDENEIQ